MLSGFTLWFGGDLLLAFFPVVLAFGLARGLSRDLAQSRVRWALWLPLAFVWLLFLPNTCYLLTEWRHYLTDIHENPAYAAIYQRGQYPPGLTLRLLLLTAFYGAYTGAGLLAFCLAVRPLHLLAQRLWGRASRWLPGAVCVPCALGVYLGLVNRFNSWDLAFPSLALSILATVRQILSHPVLLALLLAFAALLWLLYAAFDVWAEGVAVRRRPPIREKLSHAAT